MVRVGRLELPASCSQSKRATNCATPGYEVFQLWSNMWSTPIFDQLPARVKVLSAQVSQGFPGFLGVETRTRASRTQTCVGTFRRHSAALFGPFRRSGNSSLTLFCPACFKQNFLLLGWVWDWILYIKRSAVRDGSNSGPNHRREGAENAPHKQRISRLSVRQRYGGCFLSQIRKWTRTY